MATLPTVDFVSRADGPDPELLLALALDAAGPAMGRQICQWIVRACRDWYQRESDVLPRPSASALNAAAKVVNQVTRRTLVPAKPAERIEASVPAVESRPECELREPLTTAAGEFFHCFGDRFWFTGPAQPILELMQEAAPALAPLFVDRPLAMAARSPKWHALEVRHLAAHPTCMACGGRALLQVHHKVPFHLQRDRELDPRNLRTLCMAPARCCHLRIGHSMDFRAFNPHCDRDAVLSLTRILHRRYEV